MTIQATSDGFTIASANSAASAYCRFLFTPEFFKHYKIQRNAPPGLTFATPIEEPIVGELKVKVCLPRVSCLKVLLLIPRMRQGLLAVIKPRGFDKSVEKIVLAIHDGPEPENNIIGMPPKHSSVESKFLVRVYCKHGEISCYLLEFRLNPPQ